METLIAPTPASRDQEGGYRYAFPALPTIINRTMDATFLNTVANHPEVRPWIGGDGPLDLAPILENPAHVAVETAGGGFLAIALGCGRYEIHSLFLPDGRGAPVQQAMQAGLDYMFGSTDAVELLTKVPTNNAPAARLAQRAGFDARYTERVPWSVAVPFMEVEILGVTLDRWIHRAEVTLQLGRWFHESMAHALAARGSTLPVHSAESVSHNRVVGAAILMCRDGNARKAVQVYNVWATVTSYQPIRVLREQPLIVDMGGVVVEARAHEMEILRCQ